MIWNRETWQLAVGLFSLSQSKYKSDPTGCPQKNPQNVRFSTMSELKRRKGTATKAHTLHTHFMLNTALGFVLKSPDAKGGHLSEISLTTYTTYAYWGEVCHTG